MRSQTPPELVASHAAELLKLLHAACDALDGEEQGYFDENVYTGDHEVRTHQTAEGIRARLLALGLPERGPKNPDQEGDADPY